MKAASARHSLMSGIPASIYGLVRDEAVRWREAASANDWEALDPPSRSSRPANASESAGGSRSAIHRIELGAETESKSRS